VLIRLLQSSLFADYLKEIRKINPQVDAESVKDLLNPGLTFKFFHLSENSFEFLKNFFEIKKYPQWSDPGDKQAIIASFPNWSSIREITANLEFSQFPEISAVSDIQEKLERNSWEYSIGEKKFKIDRPMIMGILNVTPDSFSDGGKFTEPEAAINHACKMVDEGADIIDIGAESTRPGSLPVSIEEEWNRIFPVLKKVRQKISQPISIDTCKSEIVRRAFEEGADIVNDVSALRLDPEMAKIVAGYKAPMILMHMQGTPKDMQKNPVYENLLEEIFEFFIKQVEYAQSNGIEQIILDPGIGFGKRYEDNFELIRRLPEFRILGFSLLFGTSRKSFIGRALDKNVEERIFGTMATAAIGAINGANILRVHDVREIKDVISITEAIKNFSYFG
jgi:dihydropteroate synthase